VAIAHCDTGANNMLDLHVHIWLVCGMDNLNPDVVASDPIGALLTLVAYWQAGAYGLAGATALFLAAAVVLRLRAFLPWMGTDRGGAVTAAFLGLCTALAATLATGGALSLAVLAAGLLAAWAAVGGRQWLRRVLWPEDGQRWLDYRLLHWLLGDREESMLLAERAEGLYSRYRAGVHQVARASLPAWGQLSDAERRGWLSAARG
jgi:hypothetical protein